MREVYSTVVKGFAMLSRRGQFTVAISSLSLALLSAIDAAALYILTRSILLTANANSTGLVVDTSAVDIMTVAILFVVRSGLAIIVGRLSIIQLSHEQTQLGIQRFRQLMDVRTSVSSTHETHFFDAVHRGPEFLIMTLTNAGAFVGELVSMLVILGFFLVADSMTALLAIGYFSAITLLQHRWLAVKSALQGDLMVQSRNWVYQLLGDSSRLKVELNDKSIESVSVKLQGALARSSRSTALSFFLAYIPRQLLELTFIVGLGLVSGMVFLISGPIELFTALVLFAGISFRLMPTVNRVQGLALTMLAHAPIAKMALTEYPRKHVIEERVCETAEDAIVLQNVHFQHSGEGQSQILTDINLAIKTGYQYAVVGPSGAGKTTLASIILGIEPPTRGFIYRASGLEASFVPQDTHLAFAPLAENVSLLWHRDLIDFERVANSLTLAGLGDFVSQVFDNTPMQNSAVSGGEKQRIGLARAFYSGANFIVLDEVTNSLDAETENQIVNTLHQLRGKITTVIITHRLTTIRKADHVFYLEEGFLVGSDSYQNLSSNLSQFQKMIQLGRAVSN